MKIALLNVICAGSTGKIACTTARILQRSGHEARLYYGRGAAPDDVLAERIGSVPAVYAHVLRARIADRSGFGSLCATRRLVERLAAFDPDVIHLHNIHGYWLHLPTLFSYLRTCGKPVLWTLHDCWSFTGHCAYFDEARCERWKTGCGHCVQRSAYPQSLLLDASARNYTQKRALFTATPNLTLAVPSQWLAGLVKQSFLAALPVIVMPNGVDQAVFSPTPSALGEQYGLIGKRVLLGVANIWEPRKGLATFSELRKLLDETYAIVLIGLSEKQKRTLQPGILGLTRTANAKELAAWYTLADGLVDATREENFPTTHLEALACGTPVATFCAGGSAEMLTPSCGASAPVGDVEGLLECIDRVLSLRREDCLAQAAHYRQEDRLGAYVELYAQLIAQAVEKGENQ